jgi:hypothetical protein
LFDDFAGRNSNLATVRSPESLKMHAATISVQKEST